MDTTEVQRRDRSKTSNCPESGDIHYSIRSIEIPFDSVSSLSLRPKIGSHGKHERTLAVREEHLYQFFHQCLSIDESAFDVFPIKQSIQSCWHRTDGKVYNVQPFLTGRVSILSQECGHAIVNDISSCLLIWLGINRLFCSTP